MGGNITNNCSEYGIETRRYDGAAGSVMQHLLRIRTSTKASLDSIDTNYGAASKFCL